jgi:hypothetical protein
MVDSHLIKAPRLVVDADKHVINVDANSPAAGIAVLGEVPPSSTAEECPITAMQRWSAFRQSPVKKQGD